MCGIFAATGEEDVAPVLIEGLRRLEYRGYDSAGIAVGGAGGIEVRKDVGHVAALARLVEERPATGRSGIAHTRWATHGAPAARNSHPHLAPGLAIVHNGIVENHGELRRELAGGSASFVSETDTEVIPWLVRDAIAQGKEPWAALIDATSRLDGSYAVAMLSERNPAEIYAARKGSPLLAGIGEGKSFLSSDLNALAGFAQTAVALEDGDTARLTPDGVDVRDASGRKAQRQFLTVPGNAGAFDMGGHAHYMSKEIFEQPEVAARLDALYRDGSAMRQLVTLDLSGVRRIDFVACGTSYYAAAVARHWFQQLADIECAVHVASEYRYEALPSRRGDEIAVLISQSGETADTLAVLDLLQERGTPVIGVVNATGSTLGRRAEVTLPLAAGPEIGVASTKAFMAQLIVLAQFAIHASACRGAAPAVAQGLRDMLSRLPDILAAGLLAENAAIEAAMDIREAKSAIFVGRGQYHPLACEGALKLKEISYIHAEGFAAGELKHGPLALIDPNMPVFALAGDAAMLPKLGSNVREIAARGGRIRVIGDSAAIMSLADVAVGGLQIPQAPELLRPMATTAPLQLLAYHAATARGLNVDRPRNLAKSVTVE